MEIHKGRLLDHVHLRVADLERSKAVYHGPADRSGDSVVFTPRNEGA